MYMNCRSRSTVSHVHSQNSSSTSSSSWNASFCDLVASTDNLLALLILDVVDVLILPLSTLPDLDLAATSDDANTHSAEQVVCGIAVHVHAAIEHGGCVLADA